MERDAIVMNAARIEQLRVAKVFNDNHGKRITSLDFDETGNYCITAAEDDSMHVYDAVQGKSKQVIYSKKYGVQLVRFTHRHTNVLHTATKQDNIIRYLSLHDNRYLQYFRGHKKQVVSLDLSPKADTFLAASMDDSIRLWDLRSPNAQATMDAVGSPLVAFDPQGMIFAVGLGSKYLKLYDLATFHKGPFYSWVIHDASGSARSVEWSSMKFSNDGAHILISTKQNVHYLVDSYDGSLVHSIAGHESTTGSLLEAGFMPDSQFIYAGSDDGTIHFWDRKTAKEIATLEGHVKTVSIVQFNPKYAMLASACSNLASHAKPGLCIVRIGSPGP